jgi:TRAP transporter TAXI family solute receptor
VGWPGFVAVAKSPAGARFIAPSADEIKCITAKHTFIKPLTLAAASYPGQDAPVNTVGSWSFVLARPTLPDDVAYRLVRALHKGEAAIGKRLEQARESTMANTLAAAPQVKLLHPGTQRYLREIGLLK